MKYKVKKLLAIMLTLSLIITTVLSVPQITAGAETYGDFEYAYINDNTKVKITDYTDPGGEVVIPESIDNKPVTSIGDGAFRSCTGLTSITIPNSVTSIGNSAFYNCTGLKSIIIPNSVTSIGDYTFYNCTGLTSITIPNSVTSISGSAFDNTGYYNDLYNWENDVLYINNCLIKAKKEIAGSYTVKDGTRLIADDAFYGCTGLTSITIPESVTSIGYRAFYGCTGLTSVTIPNSVTSIGSSAFRNCSGLTSITIPSNVTSIGDYAFSGCTGLISITIPDSVTSIGDWAFGGCTGLESITVDPNNQVYHSAGNCLIKTQSKTLIKGCKNSVISTDGSVTSIGDSAFSGCTGLTSITIPDSVTSVDQDVFYGCTGLTSITIPESVTSIGYRAFYGCTGLTSITIADSVTSIGSSAFYNTGYYNDSNNWENGMLYIDNCLIKAKGTITGNYTVKDGTRLIADDAFYNCTGLTSVTIPNSVTSIGEYAFCDCSGLTSITIPVNVTTIGDYAFYGCTGLKTVVYCGTEQQWKSISIGSENSKLTSANRYYHDFDNNCDTTCNICGATRTITHKYKTVWSTDSVQHWHECSICGDKTDLADHIYDNPCDPTCNVCGYVRTAPHQYKTVWSSDETHHWHECELCGHKKDEAEHDFGEDSICDICGYMAYIPGDIDGNDEITDADAVYLLFYTFFPDDYPITQACDFDGNGAITDADAVYLLMYTFFPEDYPIA